MFRLSSFVSFRLVYNSQIQIFISFSCYIVGTHAFLLKCTVSHAIAGSITPFQQELWIQPIKPIDFGDFVCTHEARFKHHSEQCLSLSSHTVHNHPAILISRYVHTICQLELLQNSRVHGFVVLAKHGCCTMGCLSLGIWILLSLTSWGTGHWPLHSARGFKKSVLYISAQHHCSSCSFTGGLPVVQYLCFFFNIQWLHTFHLLSPQVLYALCHSSTVQFVTENGFRKD